MQFFTLDVYNQWYDTYDNDAIRVVSDCYTDHLEKMDGILPKNVLVLAKLEGVNDGLIVNIKRDRPRSTLVLTMRCGDLSIGYYDLEITYYGASISREHNRVLNYVARNQTLDLIGRTETAGELVYHEVDVADNGRFAHRIMFHPGRWFEIQVDSLRWRQIARPNRKLRDRRKRYPAHL